MYLIGALKFIDQKSCAPSITQPWHVADPGITDTRLQRIANRDHWGQAEMRMDEALELHNQYSRIQSVCNAHRQAVGLTRGLRAMRGKELDNALTVIQHEQDNLWELKTGRYYTLFRQSWRPAGPREMLGPLCFQAKVPHFSAQEGY